MSFKYQRKSTSSNRVSFSRSFSFVLPKKHENVVSNQQISRHLQTAQAAQDYERQVGDWCWTPSVV